MAADGFAWLRASPETRRETSGICRFCANWVGAARCRLFKEMRLTRLPALGRHPFGALDDLGPTLGLTLGAPFRPLASRKKGAELRRLI